MISNCANSGCAKPLLYLREGRVYIFNVCDGTAGPRDNRQRHLEHYWLCGRCAKILILSQDSLGLIHVLAQPAAVRNPDGLFPNIDSNAGA